MSSHTFVFTIVALCFVTISSASTSFTQCSNGPPPTELRVTDCTTSRCKFPRGTNVTAEWDFKLTDDTETLTPRVRATFLGITVPYQLDQDNACDTLTNAVCPLAKDDEVTYRLTMPIESVYPKIRLSIEFALLDDNGGVQVCFVLPAQIVSA